MIKDVVHSITNTKETGKTSLLNNSQAPEGEGKTSGFFGKMLLALQGSGDNTNQKTSTEEGQAEAQNNVPEKSVDGKGLIQNSSELLGNDTGQSEENSPLLKLRGIGNEAQETSEGEGGTEDTEPILETAEAKEPKLVLNTEEVEAAETEEVVNKTEESVEVKVTPDGKVLQTGEEGKNGEKAVAPTPDESDKADSSAKSLKLDAEGKQQTKQAPIENSDLNRELTNEKSEIKTAKVEGVVQDKSEVNSNTNASEIAASQDKTSKVPTSEGEPMKVSGPGHEDRSGLTQQLGSAEPEKKQPLQTVSEPSGDGASDEIKARNTSESTSRITDNQVKGIANPEITSSSKSSVGMTSGDDAVSKVETENGNGEGKVSNQPVTPAQNENEGGRMAAGSFNARDTKPMATSDTRFSPVQSNQANEMKTGANITAGPTEEQRTEPVAQQILKEKPSQGTPEIHAGIQNLKYQEAREKRYGLHQSLAQSGDPLSGDRLAPVVGSGEGNPGSGQHSSFSGSPEWLKQQINAQNSTSLSKDQEAFLKEQMMEAPETKEASKNENSFNAVRLGEMPIANSMLRRSILPGLAATMQKATSGSQAMTQNWQKHSFELEGGSSIELSTRNVDGVIQVKLASSSIELIRLMQQYGQEIKDHLEQECELNIDLQFEDNQEQGMSGFSGDSSSSGVRGPQNGRGHGGNRISTQQAEQDLQQSVRKFGYNRMEWTA